MRTTRRNRSRVLAVVASLSATVSLGTTPAFADALATQAPSTATTSPSGTDPTQSAMDVAKATGQPVAIDSATTANTQLFANPDGTLTLSVTPRPARVRQGNAWTPVDANLVRNADGSITTKATPTAVSFSPGGSGPLASMTTTQGTLAFSWPSTLPVPTLAGATATYAGVLSGVDLRLTANPYGGFSEVLVVADRKAAANPALASVQLKLTNPSLTPRLDAAGALHVTDASGSEAFTAPAPAMWDSSSPGAPTADVTGSAEAATHLVTMADSLAGGTLSLIPDQKMLTDSATVFPVYIDPVTNTPTANHYTHVQSNVMCADTSYYDNPTFGDPAAGYNHYTGCVGKERAFFAFPIPSIVYGSTVSQAYVALTQSVVSDGTPSNTYPVSVSQSGAISLGTTWNNQPSPDTSTTVTLPMDSRVGTTANFSMTSTIAAVVAAHATTWTVSVTGEETSSSNGMKRFASNPTLFIQYDHAPNAPTTLSYSPKPISGTLATCGGVADGGFLGNNSSVTLSAIATDPEGTLGGPLTQNFWVLPPGGIATTTQVPNVSNSAAGRLAVPLNATGTWSWKVQTIDNPDLMTSAWSATCTFQVNTLAPLQPQIASTFPTGTNTAPGTPGTFTFRPNAAETMTIIGYRYCVCTTLSTTNAPFVPANGSGMATVPVVAALSPSQTMHAEAIGSSANPSPDQQYTYLVGSSATPAAIGYTPGCTGTGCPVAGVFTACRLFDTRAGTSTTCPTPPSVPKAKLTAGGTLTVSLAGLGGIPANATAVTINVTAVGASTDTVLNVYPAGTTPVPTTSIMNVHSTAAIANLATVKLGTGGGITFSNVAGTVDLIVDLEGYFSPWAGSPTSPQYGYTAAGAVTGSMPCRILDTRSANPGSCPNSPTVTHAKIAANGTLSAQIASTTVSSGVKAMVLNVTTDNGGGSGVLKVYQHGVAQPYSSVLNYTGAPATPNLVVVPVGTDGVVDFYNSSSTSVDLIVDLVGWYSSWPSGPYTRPAGQMSTFVPLTNCRLFDTRGTPTSPCTGPNAPAIALPAAPVANATTGVLKIQVAGFGGIPANATAVVLNLTALNASADQTVFALPSEGTSVTPAPSSLNPHTAAAVPNLVTIKLGADGSIALSNTNGTVDLVGDLAGYYY
jgi:hypothetical protein